MHKRWQDVAQFRRMLMASLATARFTRRGCGWLLLLATLALPCASAVEVFADHNPVDANESLRLTFQANNDDEPDFSVLEPDFDILGRATLPGETDSEPIVDPNAVLPLAPAGQGFKPVAGDGGKIFQFVGVLDHAELPAGYFRDVTESPAAAAPEKFLGLFAAERADHKAIIQRCVLCGKH